MLGDAGVGKTCIVNRYIKGEFSDTEATLGANYSAKIIDVQPNDVHQVHKVKLQIWDTAGGEQFRSLAHIYYKDASAVCLCYDSTSEDSFEALQYWCDELNSKSDNTNIVKAVVATKTDWVENNAVESKRAKAYAQSVGALFMQTSAKTGNNINKLYQTIAEEMLIKELSGAPTPSNRQRAGTVDLRTRTNAGGMKK